jgi:four helix bundle protein
MSDKHYDLEVRTLKFAKQVRAFLKKLPKSASNFKDGDQPIRSSGSVGANYIEANESLGDKDFLYRIKICRKEAKESRFWLNLIDTGSLEPLEQERGALIQESTELMNIFGSIVQKMQIVNKDNSSIESSKSE